MSFLALQLLQVRKFHYLNVLSYKVHDAYLIDHLMAKISDLFLFAQEIFLAKLAVAHGVDYVLKSKRINHDVLCFYEETCHRSELQVRRRFVGLTACVVPIHELNRREDQLFVFDLELIDDLIQPVNNFDSQMSADEALIVKQLRAVCPLTFLLYHVVEVFLRITFNIHLIKSAQKRRGDINSLVSVKRFRIDVCHLSQLFNFEIKRIFGLSPSFDIFIF